MPNIGAVLKEEITRFSRRSMRAQLLPLKKAMAELKRVVIDQRRAIQKLQQDNARLLADLNVRIAKLPEVSQQEAQKTRISPRIIQAQRRRLGLSQEEFGKLLGVSAHAIFLWEHAKATPRSKVKAIFAAVRLLKKREARQRLEAMASVSKS